MQLALTEKNVKVFPDKVQQNLVETLRPEFQGIVDRFRVAAFDYYHTENLDTFSAAKAQTQNGLMALFTRSELSGSHADIARDVMDAVEMNLKVRELDARAAGTRQGWALG